jgi:hypothetical protein
LTFAAGFLVEHNPSNGTSQQRKKVNRPTVFTISRHVSPPGGFLFCAKFESVMRSPLFEIALVLMPFDHVASMIVHSNHRVMLH